MASKSGESEGGRVEAVPVAPLDGAAKIGFGRAGGPRRRPRFADPTMRRSVEVWDETGARLVATVRAARRSGGRAEPARVLAVALAIFMAAAIWKPWAGPGQPAPSPTPSAQALAVLSTPTPAVASPSARPARPLAGIDLSAMGVVDSHTTWGLSVAYVPRDQLLAATTGRAVVEPAVTWVPAATAIRAQNLDLNRPDSVVIALAVTWPAASRPIGLELMDRGSAASMQGGSGRGRSPGAVALSSPLPAVLEQAYPGAEWATQVGAVDWELVSGTYFLPPGDTPTDLADWLTSAWSPGSYAFLIRAPDGSVDTFPFRIHA